MTTDIGGYGFVGVESIDGNELRAASIADMGMLAGKFAREWDRGFSPSQDCSWCDVKQPPGASGLKCPNCGGAL